MILRPDGDDGAVVAIGQASHAWLAGQLARAWGNDHFAPPRPREEVVLGALQHDVGMARWDLRPERNPDTGLPRQFYELDRRTHLALWKEAPRLVLTQSRYAALLVSLHGTGLYERFPPRTDDPEIARAVRDYLADQRALQAALSAELGLGDDEVARNQDLVAVWDDLSLAICTGEAGSHAVPGAPASDSGRGGVRVPMTLTREGASDTYTLDPWPFGAARVDVRVEGRRLTGPSPDEDALHTALDRAPLVTLVATLHAPG